MYVRICNINSKATIALPTTPNHSFDLCTELQKMMKPLPTSEIRLKNIKYKSQGGGGGAGAGLVGGCLRDNLSL